MEEIKHFQRIQKAHDLIDKEYDALKPKSLSDYMTNRMAEFNTAVKTSHDVLKHFEVDMTKWNEEFTKLRKAVNAFNEMLMKKRLADAAAKEDDTEESRNLITDGQNATVSTRTSRQKKIAAKPKGQDMQKKIDEANRELLRLAQLLAELERTSAEVALQASEIAVGIEDMHAKMKADEKREREERERREKEEKERLRQEEERKKREEEEERKRREEEERKRKEEEEEARRQREKEDEERKREEMEKEKKRKEEEEKERIRLEEERKRREEEERKRKEEEERKRKEEEERRRKEEEERLRKEAEEAARRNPDNWEKWTYNIDTEEEDDTLGCVIRAMSESCARSDFRVEMIPPISGTFQSTRNENLVGHIIKISYTKEEEMKMEEPLSLCFPHIAPKSPSREVVVKQQFPNGYWREVETKPVKFEDIPYDLVECRVNTVSTFAVVSTIKRDRFTVAPVNGTTVTSSVDSRVSVQFRPNTVDENTKGTLTVQPVGTEKISELHSRYPEHSDVETTSHLVKLETPECRYKKNVTINVPIPVPKKKQTSPKGTPAPIHLLTKAKSGNWVRDESASLEFSEKKSSVSFDTAQPLDKFVIVQSINANAHLEKGVAKLEQLLDEYHVQMLMRQRSEDPQDVILLASTSAQIPEKEKRLSDKGFELGPPPTDVIIMRDGQDISVKLRGNIKEENGVKLMKMRFYPFLPLRSKLQFCVVVDDEYAQKMWELYRGVVQINADAKWLSAFEKPVFEDGDQRADIVAEIPLNLPKVDREKVMTKKVTIKLGTDEFVSEELLRFIASEIEDVWQEVGLALGLTSRRVQDIERYTEVSEDPAFDMLMMWIKEQKKIEDKSNMLIRALLKCKKDALAKEIRNRQKAHHVKSMKAEDTKSDPGVEKESSEKPQLYEEDGH